MMRSERSSKEEELINRAIRMLDRVISTCDMMIASYEKYKPSTPQPPTQVETLATIEEEEISVLPIPTQQAPATAESTPPPQVEALAELAKDEEEDAVGGKPAPPLSLALFPLAAPTSAYEPPPLQVKTIVVAEEGRTLSYPQNPVFPCHHHE
ncbi:unnamed protein product [Linum trigynum]|uniref:Uncharacterized protein n=1 Tax=Linum trigynum TaxID=586398 RepID=A0AAV2G8T5_9ROSI